MNSGPTIVALPQNNACPFVVERSTMRFVKIQTAVAAVNNTKVLLTSDLRFLWSTNKMIRIQNNKERLEVIFIKLKLNNESIRVGVIPAIV